MDAILGNPILQIIGAIVLITVIVCEVVGTNTPKKGGDSGS